MLKKIVVVIGLVICSWVVNTSDIWADVITLHVPIVSEVPQAHLYYFELLETALIEAGHQVELVSRKFPQTRIKHYLNNGNISLYWMVESAERNEQYIPIEVGLTDGLIGKRILFIKQGDQHLYDAVETVEDFRALHLTAGMGKNWFDAKVWNANNLQYQEEDGDWRTIYRMIPRGRKYNYFPRGLNEIVTESQEHTDIDVETRLVLIYDRDFRFYLSKTGEHAGEPYKNIIEDALQQAEESGLIDRLVRKYWANDLETLKYDDRIKLYLDTPK